MTSRTTALALAAIGLAMAISGCAPTPVEEEPSPTFSSDAEAFAAAEATYREYVKALNAVDLSDPKTFEGVWSWTAGDLNAADRESLTKYHADGSELAGKSDIALLVLADGAAADDLRLAVCLDVSSFDLVDASGASLVPENRTDIQSLLVGLVHSRSSPTGLLIEAIAPREGGPHCDSL